MTMTLVPPRNEPRETGIPVSGIILEVGDTKSGKTWLAASFPDSYTIELEHRRGNRIPFGRIDDLPERYYQLVAKLRKEETPEEEIPDRDEWLLEAFGDMLEQAIADDSIKTIVLDSVDELQKLIATDIARNAGVEFIQKPKAGVDSRALWGEYQQRIQGLTDHLKECGKLVIIIAHRRPAETDSEGKITKPAGINVSGKGGDYLAKHAEIIGFMDVRNVGGVSKHFLTFKGESNRAIWRSGVEELQDKEILISKSDPYGSFAAAFGKKVDTPKPTLVQPKKKR